MFPVSPSRFMTVAANTAFFAAAFLLMLLLPPASSQAQTSGGGGYGGYGSISCRVAYSTPMPAYFSGTSCSIGGYANAGFGYLTRVELWVGGVLVKETDYTVYDNVQAAGPSVTFDSTHFTDGSSITVTIKAWASGGRTGTHSNSAPAYNKGYDLISQRVTSEAQPVGMAIESSMISANHTVTRSDAHTEQDIISNLKTYTAFSIYTHGAEAIFGDCFAYENLADHYLSTSDVATAVDGKGSGFSQIYPSYGFVHIFACSVLRNNSTAMPAAFRIYPGSVNQAFLSWQLDMAGGAANHYWLKNLWNGLCNQGKTLQESIDYANYLGIVYYGGTEDGIGCWIAGYSRKIPPSVVGDRQMKLHGVYGGQGLQWYL